MTWVRAFFAHKTKGWKVRIFEKFFFRNFAQRHVRMAWKNKNTTKNKKTNIQKKKQNSVCMTICDTTVIYLGTAMVIPFLHRYCMHFFHLWFLAMHLWKYYTHLNGMLWLLCDRVFLDFLFFIFFLFYFFCLFAILAQKGIKTCPNDTQKYKIDKKMTMEGKKYLKKKRMKNRKKIVTDKTRTKLTHTKKKHKQYLFKPWRCPTFRNEDLQIWNYRTCHRLIGMLLTKFI